MKDMNNMNIKSGKINECKQGVPTEGELQSEDFWEICHVIFYVSNCPRESVMCHSIHMHWVSLKHTPLVCDAESFVYWREI